MNLQFLNQMESLNATNAARLDVRARLEKVVLMAV
jgi:hypothetical protein